MFHYSTIILPAFTERAVTSDRFVYRRIRTPRIGLIEMHDHFPAGRRQGKELENVNMQFEFFFLSWWNVDR